MLDTLRPPEGYHFDRAIGTTYTLDLESLLVAPLAFTFFDWEEADGQPTADPLALLEAVRRHAGRIHLFCQAGEIKIPSPDQRLLPYLEQTVIQVRAPHPGGLFHPKVWVVRFRPIDAEDPVQYRLVCMSRNLTNSRSWDTTLVLDGVLRNRRKAIRRSAPLGEFLGSLPEMAIRAPDPDVVAAVSLMQDEVRRVDFELPDGFDDARLHPLGHAGVGGWPFPDAHRTMLVLSPFVSGTFLRRLADTHRLKHLISRPEALAALPSPDLALVDQAWAMSPQADLDSQEGTDDELAEDTLAAGDELAGLHAKLFVMDDGWHARVWTGSANATEAAFERNVEFLVELIGRKSQCGIEALMGDTETEEGLRPLLQPCGMEDPDPEPDDPSRAELRTRLRRAAQMLLDANLGVGIEATGDDRFSLTVSADTVIERPPGVSVELWPATLRAASAKPLAGTPPSVVFSELSIDAVTAFVGCRLTAREGSTVEEERFVLLLPISGAPPDRLNQILRGLLTDPEQVMRLLLFLLSGEGLQVHYFDRSGHGGGTWTPFGASGGPTLLESLLKALATDPTALDHAETLILDLQQTEEGRALLPAGLEQIWEPIRRTRQETRE